MTPHLVVVGNPGCRRVGFWKAAAARLGWRFGFVSYHSVFDGWHESLAPGTVVRVETPGRDWGTFQRLLNHGIEPALQDNYAVLDSAATARLEYDRGRLVKPRQAHLGFIRLLSELQRQLESQRVQLMHSAEEIAVCFDKPVCQARLEQNGVPTPRSFGSPRCYDELQNTVREHKRVMVKLAHGSGGAGCVAIHHSGGRTRGITTVAQVPSPEGIRLYHSKHPIPLESEVEVARLVDRLCEERVQAEAWLPKAQLDGRNIDLRIVTIGGEARHTAVRCSDSVFTNLSMGNARESWTAVAAKMGANAWESVRDTCAAAAAAFPRSFTLGLDVLIRPDWKRFQVLEVNAFGDLLVQERDRDEDTYTATLNAWQRVTS